MCADILKCADDFFLLFYMYFTKNAQIKILSLCNKQHITTCIKEVVRLITNKKA